LDFDSASPLKQQSPSRNIALPLTHYPDSVNKSLLLTSDWCMLSKINNTNFISI